MDIYSNSRFNNIEDLFDSLVGRDAWIQISVLLYNQETVCGWVQLLSNRIDDNGSEGYDVYWVDSDYVDDDGVCRTTVEDFEDFTSYVGFIIPDYVNVVKPLEILSTDEFFEFE